MNVRANLAEVGAKLWQEHSGLRQDVALPAAYSVGFLRSQAKHSS